MKATASIVTKDQVIRNMFFLHKKNLVSLHQDFLPTANGWPIFESADYYYKRVDMFGECELRIFKKSGKVSVVRNQKKFTCA